jgi:DNA-binding MarR family transcriptional regulator
MGWDNSRLPHQVRRMERRGLVAREQHPQDRRGAVIGLTQAGQRAIEQAPGRARRNAEICQLIGLNGARRQLEVTPEARTRSLVNTPWRSQPVRAP